MAEFCKECYIRLFKPTKAEIKRIVMSKDEDLCEGCGQFKQVVVKLKPSFWEDIRRIR